MIPLKEAGEGNAKKHLAAARNNRWAHFAPSLAAIKKQTDHIDSSEIACYTLEITTKRTLARPVRAGGLFIFGPAISFGR